MAEIMEFLINLLLIRGKYLKTTAAERLQGAIKKCMHYKRKISEEYNIATQMIASFENMLDFINFNAQHYRAVGDNCVVTSEVRYDLYEFCKMKKFGNRNVEKVLTGKEHDAELTALKEKKEKNEIKNLSSNLPRNDKELEKIYNEERILDNVQAILKSQEILFKNVYKLLTMLEAGKVISHHNEKLNRIKRKLLACTDILSNISDSKQFSNIINNLIEEELARYKMKNAPVKTKGLESVLETIQNKHIMNKGSDNYEQKKIEMQMKKETDRIVTEILAKEQNQESINALLHESGIDLENSKKLIEVNEEHFKRFEDNLWHSLTTMKFLSLKDEYLNVCKCAFYNKRQFIATEAEICKRCRQQEEQESMERFLKISESMFQFLERKLLFESVQNELCSSGWLSLSEDIAASLEKPKTSEENKQIQENATRKLVLANEDKEAESKRVRFKEDKSTNTAIDGIHLQKVYPKTKKAILEKDIKSGVKMNPVKKDQQINTILNSHNMKVENQKKEPILVKPISKFGAYGQVKHHKPMRIVLSPAAKSKDNESSLESLQSHKEITEAPDWKEIGDFYSGNYNQKLLFPQFIYYNFYNLPTRNKIIAKENQKKLEKGVKITPSEKLVSNKVTSSFPRQGIRSRSHPSVLKPEKKVLQRENFGIGNQAKSAEHLQKKSVGINSKLLSLTTNSGKLLTFHEVLPPQRSFTESNTDSDCMVLDKEAYHEFERKNKYLQNAKKERSKYFTRSATSIRSAKTIKTIIQNKHKSLENNSKLLSVATNSGKLITLHEAFKNKERSLHDLKNEGERIEVSQKAFVEFEKKIKLFVDPKPKKATTGQGKKRKIEETEKKSMSTKRISKESSTYQNVMEMSKPKIRYSLPNEKTFLKKSPTLGNQKLDCSFREISSRKSSKSTLNDADIKLERKNSAQMRRTTKNAIKRQQVKTILPKVTKEKAVKSKPHVVLVETKESQGLKSKIKTESKSSVKAAVCALSKSAQKSNEKIHCEKNKINVNISKK